MKLLFLACMATFTLCAINGVFVVIKPALDYLHAPASTLLALAIAGMVIWWVIAGIYYGVASA